MCDRVLTSPLLVLGWVHACEGGWVCAANSQHDIAKVLSVFKYAAKTLTWHMGSEVKAFS